jgi:outer membrane protein TolC
LNERKRRRIEIKVRYDLKVVRPFLIAVLLVTAAGAQTITLDQFLNRAVAEHPLIEENDLSEDIIAETRVGLLSAQDWRFSGEATFLHSKPFATSSFAPTTIDQFGITAGLHRSLWSSGGNLRFDLSSTAVDQTIPGITIPGAGESIETGLSTLYEHSLSLSYSQPLLRNYKGRLDRLQYDLTEFDQSITNLQVKENKESFLLTLALGFIDWVLLDEKQRIAAERLRLAQEERQLTAEKRRANLVDEVDVLRSEDAVRLATQNQVLLRSQARAKQAELSVLADLPQLRELQPEYDLYQLLELPEPGTADSLIAANSRLLSVLQRRADQLQRHYAAFQENRKPELNANVGLALKGGDDGFANSLEMTKPDFSLGLVLNQSLGARAAESDARRTQLELNQIAAQQQRVQLELESRLLSLLVLLEDLEEILDLNREQIESARLKTAEERRLYNQGRSELTFVIQAEDNERNARLTYAENAAGYHRLYQQYLAVADLLLTVED